MICREHKYRSDGTCLFCGKEKATLNGEWPVGTWLQRRRAAVAARELGIELRNLREVERRQAGTK